MNKENSSGLWRPVPLVICNILAILLIISWYGEAGRVLWEQADAWVFYKLNGSLSGGHYWQLFWAAANTKRFDITSALVILFIYMFYIFSGKRKQIVNRTAVGVLILFSTVLAIQFSKNFLDYGRPGPSSSLQPVILLTEIISGFEFRDHSGSSFPGNHGIALIMFTSMVWFFAGRTYGLVMLLLSAFLMLPPMVVGAHWLTDNLVGSAYVSLVALSWILATPLHARLIRMVTPLVSKSFAMNERLLAFIGGGPANTGTELANSPLYALKGFCMGSADIIPGVSGGTMALILGIYERLLSAIRSFDRAWLQSIFRFRISEALARNDLLFLIPLGFGIVFAIIFFTRIIPLPTLIITHPELIYGLFFGLVLASIVILMGEVEKYGARELIITIAGVVLGFTIVNFVPVETPNAAWFIFLCGFIAISAMLLPGISGSFILLILGKYAYVINALGSFDLVVIATFGLGALSGLVVFSRTIVWLLKRYHQPTLLVIKGILIGSLWIIWPFQERVYETVRDQERLVGASPIWPDAFNSTVAASASFMIAGFILVMIIYRLSSRKSTPVGTGVTE
jgi:putative membrane protein